MKGCLCKNESPFFIAFFRRRFNQWRDIDRNVIGQKSTIYESLIIIIIRRLLKAPRLEIIKFEMRFYLVNMQLIFRVHNIETSSYHTHAHRYINVHQTCITNYNILLMKYPYPLLYVIYIGNPLKIISKKTYTIIQTQQ